MDNDIKKLSNDLRAGREAERTLPMVMNEAASAYGMLALYNLLMDYQTYSESVQIGTFKESGSGKEEFFKVDSIIKENILGEYSPEKNAEAVARLIELREKLIKRMDVLTSYTDRLTLCEYVINRLEMKFEDKTFPEMDNDGLARDILEKIFATNDNALINSNIRDMLANLPVRMTKSKMLDYITDSFNVYKNAEKESVDTYDYMLRCAAGIYKPEAEKEIFAGLCGKVEKLEGMVNQKEVSKEDYLLSKEILDEACDEVKNLSEEVESTARLANECLTILLCKPYFTLSAERECTKLYGILKELTKEDPDIAELFGQIEGEMELVSERVSEIDAIVQAADEKYEKQFAELLLTTVHEAVRVSARLNSGSLFASLKEQEKETTEEGYALKVRDAFLSDITKVFEESERERMRAVMASVLKELPVFFGNRTEVMEYVRNSLDKCRDNGEKYISVELLNSCFD
ncbi:MAG: hypothetical protein K6B75_08540 [Lachnospiraceae bacterium]|nr:hypothetical protein [Lachnospiraceae bacterium]